jgi:putative aldouronate transport system substrate-binding protein
MKFIAYCVSKEGRLLNGVGIEGVHWDWQTRDGYTVAIVRDEYFKIYQSGMNNQAYKDIGFFDFYAFNDELWSASMSVFIPSLQTPNEKQMADYMKGHIYYNIPMGLITPGASSEEGVIEARLKELTSNYYVQMIMAPNNQEAERIYREFLSRAEGMGLAKLEAVWTQKYVQAGGNPQSEYVK